VGDRAADRGFDLSAGVDSARGLRTAREFAALVAHLCVLGYGLQRTAPCGSRCTRQPFRVAFPGRDHAFHVQFADLRSYPARDLPDRQRTRRGRLPPVRRRHGPGSPWYGPLRADGRAGIAYTRHLHGLRESCRWDARADDTDRPHDQRGAPGDNRLRLQMSPGQSSTRLSQDQRSEIRARRRDGTQH
jgi:hypothetical protein